jgi:hypothetical protein
MRNGAAAEIVLRLFCLTTPVAALRGTLCAIRLQIEFQQASADACGNRNAFFRWDESFFSISRLSGV